MNLNTIVGACFGLIAIINTSCVSKNSTPKQIEDKYKLEDTSEDCLEYMIQSYDFIFTVRPFNESVSFSEAPYKYFSECLVRNDVLPSLCVEDYFGEYGTLYGEVLLPRKAMSAQHLECDIARFDYTNLQSDKVDHQDARKIGFFVDRFSKRIQEQYNCHTSNKICEDLSEHILQIFSHRSVKGDSPSYRVAFNYYIYPMAFQHNRQKRRPDKQSSFFCILNSMITARSEFSDGLQGYVNEMNWPSGSEEYRLATSSCEIV